MRKRIAVSVTAIVALGCVLFFLFFKGEKNDYSFRFDKVSKGSMSVYVTATGTINAVTSVDVGTQVSGIISKLYADFNSVVKQGQIIAQIDSTFLVQSVKDADAGLEKAVAQEADSKRNFDREKALLAQGLDSQINYDAALTTYEGNKAATKSAEATLDRAKINLAYATIYAPISGVVINRAVMVGQTVAASFSSPLLFTIANDLTKMQVETTVDESDIGRVSIGETATFTVDAYPDQKFSGVVSQIRLAPVTIQNVVNYTVIIDVNNSELKLMPGMTANVKILVASADDVLRVPNMALRLQPPMDVVDTSFAEQLRSGFSRRNQGDAGPGAAADTLRRGAGSQFGSAPNSGSNGGGGMMGGNNSRQFGDSQMMMWRSKRFQEVRDSLQAKYGSTLSRDDMRNKIVAVMQKEIKQGSAKPMAPAPRRIGNPVFGIENNYPEYQKSAYDPSSEMSRGRIWTLNADGKMQPVMVITGLNDGKYTQVISTRLNDGDRIVIGVLSNGDAVTSQTRNPFAPSGQAGGNQTVIRR